MLPYIQQRNPTLYNLQWLTCTLGKFTSKAAIIAIVEEQTNAAELDSPDPKIQKKNK